MRTRHLHLTVGDRIGQTADVELPDLRSCPHEEADPTLHRFMGGYVVVRTAEADEDNGWDASVVVCASLDSRAYATPEVARALAADLLAAADAVTAGRPTDA